MSKPVRGVSVFNRSLSEHDAKSWFRVENAKKGSDTTHVYIYDEIGGWGIDVQSFVIAFNEIDTKKVKLHINSPGGDLFDGIALYNTVKDHPAEVEVQIDAMAASAASFIAQAGNTRVMTRNATMMIHDGIAFCYGNEEAMLYTANLLNKFSDNIADIYAKNAGGTVDEWRGLMREETWYSAQEAVDAGLADSMLDADDEDAEKASNKWNLSIFNHEGRDKAPSPASVLRAVQNKLKENPVGPTPAKPQASTDPAPTPQPTPATPVEPTGDPATPASPDQPDEPPEPTPAAPQPATPSSPPANLSTNQGFTFSVGGQAISDYNAVQAHITNLETFQTETKKAGKKAFVEGLASSNKILASQIVSTTEFAESLTDVQYEAWVKTWNVSGPIAPLQTPGVDPANPQGTPATVEAQNAQKLDDLKGIVRQHQLANMPTDQIEKTPSYKQLLVLDPTFTL